MSRINPNYAICQDVIPTPDDGRREASALISDDYFSSHTSWVVIRTRLAQEEELCAFSCQRSLLRRRRSWDLSTISENALGSCPRDVMKAGSKKGAAVVAAAPFVKIIRRDKIRVKQCVNDLKPYTPGIIRLASTT